MFVGCIQSTGIEIIFLTNIPYDGWEPIDEDQIMSHISLTKVKT